MPEVLITGFFPESQAVQNASDALIARLESDPQEGWQLLRLPQSAAALRRDVPDLIGQWRPRLTILCGQAPGSNRLALECVALNLLDFALADVDGAQPRDLPIQAEAPLALKTALPVPALAAGLREAGFPAVASYHAGTYLCNMAYFLALRQILQAGAADQRVLFVHIPLMPSQLEREPAMRRHPCLPSDYVADAVRHLIAAIAALRPREEPNGTSAAMMARETAGTSAQERAGLWQ